MTLKEIDNVCQNSVPYFPEENNQDGSNVSSSESAASRILTQLINRYTNLRGIGLERSCLARIMLLDF
jgi:hypothetical protein